MPAGLKYCFAVCGQTIAHLPNPWVDWGGVGEAVPSMTRSKEDAEQWWVLSAEATQETVEVDSPFIRRRKEIVIPQDDWSVGPMRWHVGWDRNMQGASFAYQEQQGPGKGAL